jgi:hypothetical protein
MRRARTTRNLSDAHESFVADLLGMRLAKASGNQFNDQMDGRHDDGPWRFAFDGKATRGKSIGVSREMWNKAVDQSHGAHPLLPLRFYHDDDRLVPELDLVVCDLHDLAAMLEELRA